MSPENIALVISAIANVAVVISLISVRESLKTYRLNALQEIDRVFDDNRELFSSIYNFPSDIVCNSNQFPKFPPKRHHARNYINNLDTRLKLRPEQINAMKTLTDVQITEAKKCINALNNIMQLVEHGALPIDYLLSAHHIQILRLIYIVEPIRRFEEKRGGGNYGHRLLRLQHKAFYYNQMYSKHRTVGIGVIMHNGGRVINKPIIPATKGNCFNQFKISIVAKIMFYV